MLPAKIISKHTHTLLADLSWIMIVLPRDVCVFFCIVVVLWCTLLLHDDNVSRLARVKKTMSVCSFTWLATLTAAFLGGCECEHLYFVCFAFFFVAVIIWTNESIQAIFSSKIPMINEYAWSARLWGIFRPLEGECFPYGIKTDQTGSVERWNFHLNIDFCINSRNFLSHQRLVLSWHYSHLTLIFFSRYQKEKVFLPSAPEQSLLSLGDGPIVLTIMLHLPRAAHNDDSVECKTWWSSKKKQLPTIIKWNKSQLEVSSGYELDFNGKYWIMHLSRIPFCTGSHCQQLVMIGKELFHSRNFLISTRKIVISQKK